MYDYDVLPMHIKNDLWTIKERWYWICDDPWSSQFKIPTNLSFSDFTTWNQFLAYGRILEYMNISNQEFVEVRLN